MKPTVSVRTFKLHLARHQFLNGQIDEVFIQETLSIEPENLLNDDDRIPLSCVYALINYTAQVEQDPILGLRYSKGQYASFIQSAQSLKKAAFSLPDYINIISRYLCLSTEIGSFSWYQTENRYEILIQFNPVDPDHITYHQVDGAMMMLKEAIFAKFRLEPRHISFKHTCPADQERTYSEYFECEVRFNQPQNSIAYKDEACLTPNDQIYPIEMVNTFALLEKARHQQQPTSLSNSVVFLIERSLIRGEPSRENIAKILFLSVRTLQRRLSQENTTYQALLEKTRKRLTQQFLANPNVTHTDIALWLGYSEASQYYQAFKRWYGHSAKDHNPTQDLRSPIFKRSGTLHPSD
ncbi:MAG: AraC family transcriptional regulator [Pseudomonadales bacterium]|nr:AraC family transcriptional regulator [Pseudomonadales bacterium]